jgi:hypothetical protein
MEPATRFAQCGHRDRHPDRDSGLCGWCEFDLEQDRKAEAELDRLRDEDAERASALCPTGEWFDRAD